MSRVTFLAALLAGSCGIIDAIAWLLLNNTFVANQTGNTVLLGIAVAKGNLPSVRAHLVPVLAFSFGVLVSRGVREWLAATWREAPLLPIALEILVLVAGAFTPEALLSWLVLALSFITGLQNGAITRFGQVSLNTAVITGTLEKFGEAVAKGLKDGFGSEHRSAATRTALAWFGYLAGASIGTLGSQSFGLHALLIPAALLLILLPPLRRELEL